MDSLEADVDGLDMDEEGDAKIKGRLGFLDLPEGLDGSDDE